MVSFSRALALLLPSFAFLNMAVGSNIASQDSSLNLNEDNGLGRYDDASGIGLRGAAAAQERELNPIEEVDYTTCPNSDPAGPLSPLIVTMETTDNKRAGLSNERNQGIVVKLEQDTDYTFTFPNHDSNHVVKKNTRYMFNLKNSNGDCLTSSDTVPPTNLYHRSLLIVALGNNDNGSFRIGSLKMDWQYYPLDDSGYYAARPYAGSDFPNNCWFVSENYAGLLTNNSYKFIHKLQGGGIPSGDWILTYPGGTVNDPLYACDDLP